jgi:molybdopterin-guanine dinucleotide biosynthesis protein B
MIPIVSIVGKSDSGKTFLIEQLVSALTSRGYRIATIKHDVHGFEMDREGKDSWRHKQAGASTVIVSSPTKIAMIKEVEQEESLEWIRDTWIRDVDLILTEGYKRADYPKVEVSLFTASDELICAEQSRLVAVVSKHGVSLDVPVFSEEEIPRFVDWVEERFLRDQGSGVRGQDPASQV